MDYLHSLVQGILQGLTEFLPVSSSGHLVIIQDILKFPGPALVYNIFLHFGTLLAVIVFWWKDILRIMRDMVKHPFDFQGENVRLFWYLVLANIPTIIIGLVIRHYLSFVFQQLLWTAAALLINGMVLIISDRFPRGDTRIGGFSLWKIITIGLAQGIAIFPGISRAGLTIVSGIFLGGERKEVARFSFLLAIPVILGITLIEAGGVNWQEATWGVSLLVGVGVAFLSGLLGIKILLKLLFKLRFQFFGFYCLVIGIAVIIWKIISTL